MLTGSPRGLLVASAVELLVFGLVIGVLGSMFIANVLYGINSLQYLSSIPRFVGPWTIFCGLSKAFVYGAIVASVATFKGFNASGGAKGVGTAVTQSAVYTNLYIVLANTVTSLFLDTAHFYVKEFF